MRLDQFLVLKKGIESRNKAQELIEKGLVVLTTQKNKVLTKASFDVTPELGGVIEITDLAFIKYVSRAGLKLEAALKNLNLSVQNMKALDIGQSTGGFTDCLLQMGVDSVVGIDVGQSQLHEKVRSNSRVTFFENLNAKNLSENAAFLQMVPAGGFDLIVCDVSFISLSQVMPHLVPFLKSEGVFLFLVKPQFECGIDSLDKNGIVKNASVYADVQTRITDEARKIFGQVQSFFESSLLGKEGNKEFFIYGTKS